MRKYIVLYALTLGLCFSCTSSTQDEDIVIDRHDEKEITISIEDTITKNITNVCTTWGVSAEQVKNEMKDFTLVLDRDGKLHFIDAQTSSVFTYLFDKTGLVSSALISPAITDNQKKNEILSNYSYIGNKAGTRVYHSQATNTFGFNYEINFDNEDYSVFGFSPIESNSDLFYSFQEIIVTTTSASSVEGYTATLNGTISGVQKSEEVGFIYGTNASLSATSGTKVSTTSSGQFNFLLKDLSSSTQYYYRAYALIQGSYIYGEVKSFTTEAVTFGSLNGHEYVDLGLSVKWATYNVGATKPEEYGEYFAWGETGEKTSYSWLTYKWCDNSNDNLKKYCTSSSYGTVDNKIVLESCDDAATVNWGDNWRMPTIEELEELGNINNCTWTWMKVNGINGYNVVSKKNGNSIFLPATGFRYSNVLYTGTGTYWSSSLYSSHNDRAFYFYFNSDKRNVDFTNRYYGRSIRAVCK